MLRRSFLKSAAAAVPAASLHSLLAAQAPAPPPAELHVVGDGEDRFGHPHHMGFSSMLFKVSTGETDGRLFLIEHRNLTAGGPPLHFHWNQEEWFYVMEGEVEFLVGEQRVRLKPGESVLAPRRVPHTFAPVSATPSRLIIGFTPAGKMEAFFRDAEKAAPNGNIGVFFQSDPKILAPFFANYEMQLLGPSPLHGRSGS